jgi:hypothetical protein
LPTIVVEVGGSDSDSNSENESGYTYTQLKEDARAWLETGEVNLVILVLIEPQGVFIEQWQRSRNSDGEPEGVGSRLYFPSPQQQQQQQQHQQQQQQQQQHVPRMDIPYAAFDIPGLTTGTLSVPMEGWARVVWGHM